MKSFKSLIFGFSLVGAICAANATPVTVTFSPTGLGTMDGTYYYTWGVNWSVPTGDSITAASLSYNNIKLTSFGINDPGILWSHLLNTTSGSGTASVTQGTDNDNGSDAFASQGLYLGKATFPTLNVAQNLSYPVDTTTLTSYASDGHFAIGIDPDCHYTDTLIVLSITYDALPPQSVPDAGSTVMLLGIALPLLGLFRRSK